MLVSLTLENWKSFREETTFSLEIVEDTEYGHRVPVSKRQGIKVLPIAAIFGGNASGKSNLLKALSFMQDCVTDPAGEGNLSAADPFRLDEAAGKPTRLCAEILSRQKLYEFSFAVLDGAVVEEKLVRHTKSREVVLYEREGAGLRFGKSQKNMDLLASVAQQTRPDRLFLSMCSALGIPDYTDVSDWFGESLVMVSPDRRLSARLIFEHPVVFSALQEILPSMDTGISRIGQRVAPLGDIRPPDASEESFGALQDGLGRNVKEGTYHDLPFPFAAAGGAAVTRENGKLLVRSLAFYHSGKGGQEIELGIGQLSGGTLHLINLLPAIILLAHGGRDRVLVIDEIGSNLHTHLMQDLLERYLMCCAPGSRSQLLFTTHDVYLMDESLLSREEIWVTERDGSGESELSALSDFKDFSPDADIRKGYLIGNVGGIPEMMGYGLGVS